MSENGVNVCYEKSIAKVTLARPDKANAICESMWKALGEIFTNLSHDANIKVIILDAQGEHFCSGIELGMLDQIFDTNSQLASGQNESIRSKIITLQETVSQVEKCLKPVIVSIQGACIGGGVDLITACDVRYGTESSYFSVKEAAIGITADLGTLQRLPTIVGQGIAREWAFTCKNVKADEAFRRGLINQIFPDQEAMQAEAIRVANLIASHPSSSIRGTKHILNYSRDHPTDNSLDYVATWNAAMLSQAEIKEALRALQQKRR